ncbi:MAG: RlmE family RNA methyltransferase [Desulfovibrionales bacterium]|nr:MAG: RlmE family RNA methyltransferase [Desulfovibrionales bacterium]
MRTYRDQYFQKAKQEKFPARSVYKLKEADKRFKLLRPGQKVLDLGASPGSWSLYAAEKVGPAGRLLALDLNPLTIDLPDQAMFMQGDVFDESGEGFRLIMETAPFDVVLSDMAPRTTGVKFADQARSMDLASQALALCKACLIKGGSFVVKFFEAQEAKLLLDEMRTVFVRVQGFKPKSSRAESKEMFYIATGKKDIAP